MKLIMRHKEEKELLQWYFDDQTPVLTPSETNDPEVRFRGQCASSTTGKLFIYGGATGTKNIKMSNISKHN